MCSEFEQAVKSNSNVKEALRNVFAAFLEADPSEVVVMVLHFFHRIETSKWNERISGYKDGEIFYRGMGS